MEFEELYQNLVGCLNTVKLGVAGRLLYYDGKMFILGIHATSPEQAEEATQLAWDGIPENLKAELQAANIGFAGKQI